MATNICIIPALILTPPRTQQTNTKLSLQLNNLTFLSQIRAYTSKNKFSETSWSQPISTDPDNTAILVGITVPIVLLVVILLAFVILRKLQCGGCHKTAAHHITRGGPPVDSVN